MEGDRDQQVGSPLVAERPEGLGEHFPEGAVEVELPPILETVNGVAQRPLVGAEGGDRGKGRGAADAGFAEMARTGFTGKGEGAAGTAGQGEGGDLLAAVVAQPCAVETGQLPGTEGAGRGKKELDQAGHFMTQAPQKYHPSSSCR
jgi:hypothetical protein